MQAGSGWARLELSDHLHAGQVVVDDLVEGVDLAPVEREQLRKHGPPGGEHVRRQLNLHLSPSKSCMAFSDLMVDSQPCTSLLFVCHRPLARVSCSVLSAAVRGSVVSAEDPLAERARASRQAARVRLR